MKIFLIHDHLRKDREVLYNREFAIQGITEWEMIPAVKDQDKIVKNIAEAHKNCIRRGVQLQRDCVVIIEDDVMFSAPGAFNRFLELINSTPDWDIITSGSYDYTGVVAEPLMKLERFSGLHCYAVNNVYYNKFLDIKVTGQFDKLLRGNLWMTYPMLALQHDGYSDNVRRITQYNKTHRKKTKLWNNEQGTI